MRRSRLLCLLGGGLCGFFIAAIAWSQFSTDSQGNVTVNGVATGIHCTGCAGFHFMQQGTPPASLPPNTFAWVAPASIPTSFAWHPPSGDCTGYLAVNADSISCNAGTGNGGGGNGGSAACMTPQSITVATAQPSVTFSGIPATCHDLLISIQARGDANVLTDAVYVTFNGDTDPNYDYNAIATQATNPKQATSSMLMCLLVTNANTPNYASGCEIKIPNYAGTVFQKSAIAETTGRLATNGSMYSAIFGGEWSGTGAIVSVTLATGLGNLMPGSSFYLSGQ